MFPMRLVLAPSGTRSARDSHRFAVRSGQRNPSADTVGVPGSVKTSAAVSADARRPHGRYAT